MKQLKIILLSIICLVSILFAPALIAASVNVRPLIIDLGQNKKVKTDIYVFNTSNQRVYVKVNAQAVEAPGTKAEKLIFERNPKKLGVLVSPSKLAIPARQRRIVRVVLTKPAGTKERSYRINIIPVSGAVDVINKSTGRASGIKVIVAYAVKVFVRPKNSTPHITIKRQGKFYTAINRGNTNGLLTIKQCSGDKKCKPIAAHRLYAGGSWKYSAPNNKPLTFLQEYMKKETRIYPQS